MPALFRLFDRYRASSRRRVRRVELARRAGARESGVEGQSEVSVSRTSEV